MQCTWRCRTLHSRGRYGLNVINSCSSGQAGCDYFTKTRASNKNILSHYFLNVVIPCITHTGQLNQIHDLGYFFSTDSEDVIISQAFTEKVHNALVNNHIRYARIGASLTSIHQACDVQETFRQCKHFVKTRLADNLENAGDQNIKNFFARAFSKLRVVLKDKAASHHACISRKMFSTPIINSRCIYITRKIVSDRFRRSGQHIDDKNSFSTISFTRMMNQCEATISTQQLLLKQNVRQRGTYHELQGINPRDGYTLGRTEMRRIHHWAEVITHPNIVTKYHAEIQARLPEVMDVAKANRIIEARNTKICQRQIAEDNAELTKARGLVESRSTNTT